jgi:hypothetical protein
MSAAATTTTDKPAPRKALQKHLVTHLAALAMLLDEDHVEELILTLFRDNDMLGMIYHRGAITEVDSEVLDEVFDAGALFEALNSKFWEEGRKFLASRIACAGIESTIPGRDTIQLVGGACAGSDKKTD